MQKRRVHYAWWISLGCFAIQGGALGIVTNCRGVFFGPVCSDLGFGLGDLTLYTTFYGFAVFLSMPLVAKIIDKWNIRILFSCTVTAVALSLFSTAFFNQVYQWYIVGIIQGIGFSVLLALPVPLMINNWFTKRKGLVMGLVTAGAGIVGAIMNPVLASLIETNGWRFGYALIGVVYLVMILPFSLFVFRLTPQEMGLEPYGGPEEAQEKKDGVPVKTALRMPVFWCLVLLAALVGSLTAYNQMLPGYGVYLGYSGAFGATLISVAMFANISGKLALGAVHDRFGANRAQYAGMVLVVAAFVLLLFGESIVPLMLGAMFTGAPMAVNTVLTPLLTLRHFGNRDYTKILSYTLMASSLCSSLGYTLFGTIIGQNNAYNASLYTALAIALAAGVLSILQSRMYKRNQSIRKMDHYE